MQRQSPVVRPSPGVGGLGLVPGAFQFDLAEVVLVVETVPLRKRAADAGSGAVTILVFEFVQYAADEGTGRLRPHPGATVVLRLLGPLREVVDGRLFGVAQGEFLVVQLGEAVAPAGFDAVEVTRDATVEFLAKVTDERSGGLDLLAGHPGLGEFRADRLDG